MIIMMIIIVIMTIIIMIMINIIMIMIVIFLLMMMIATMMEELNPWQIWEVHTSHHGSTKFSAPNIISHYNPF